MRSLFRRLALLAAAGTLLAPALAHAGVQAGQPFPSNLQTVADASQPTGLRVDLPMPAGCLAGHPSDCDDVAVLNGLDGFNVQPRIAVPLDGPIDTATFNSDTIHLYDTSCLVCAPVGIDQRVWEPLTTTLRFESADFLKEGTTYLLVVTTGVHDASGAPLDRTSFLHDLSFGQTKDANAKVYRKDLKKALDDVGAFTDAAAASLFTTQTTTDGLQAIRAQLDAAAPAAATIEASIPFSTITGFTFNRQTTTAPGFSSSTGAFPLLGAVPGAVGRVVFGSYLSKQYETADRIIPAVPVVPAVQSSERIEFTLVLPAAPAPLGGYPVALFGHGFGDNKNNSPFAVAAIMASQGIATIAINVVGHGGGPLGTLTVTTPSGPVTVPAGGRAIDQDGNGAFDSTEGLNATAKYGLVGNRDGLRQTVADLMQLTRTIRGGGIPGLSQTRIYYFGQSLGGIYGTTLLGADPLLRAGVPNVPGGSIVEVARLGGFRGLIGLALLAHQPPIYNASPPNAVNFVEDMPLRGLPVLTSTWPGASAVAQQLEWSEWAQQSANPVSYAHLLNHDRVIIQFAKGDRTVPNPTSTAIVRAGGLADRTLYYRNDIAGPTGGQLFGNPHTFLTSLPTAPAVQGQTQIAVFFASDGTVAIDPDGPGPVFEWPIQGPLPEGLN
jgi:hypothetical protein